MTKEEVIRIATGLRTDFKCESNTMVDFCNTIIKALKQEPKTGHWIKYDDEYFTTERLTPLTHSIRECSECHTKIADFCGEMKYCPNCGTKMESEVKE